MRVTADPKGLPESDKLRPSSEQLSLLSARPPVRLPVLDVRQRGTSFHQVPVKAILNSPASTGMGFWSLNPYVGCEFGCTYCYARDTHRWVVERLEGQGGGQADGRTLKDSLAVAGGPSAHPPDRPSASDAFEHRILVKTSAAAVLQRTLFPAKLAGATLVIGTATDPYQPAERRFRLTRSVLEALLGWRGLTLGITTKSPLILRDLALLQQLAARHTLSVNISLASVDAALLRRIEARSPAPHARLRALKGLTDGGIHAGLLIAPVLPGITDSRESLAAVLAAGKAAGARYAVGLALRLGSAARHRFLPHLAQEFPELVERYEQHYARRQSAQRTYTEALGRRLRALQREFGFPVRGEKRRGQGALKDSLRSRGSGEQVVNHDSPVSQGSLLPEQLQ
ncbi:MAG: radical SAM protein [Gemmatimonadales bacterium]